MKRVSTTDVSETVEGPGVTVALLIVGDEILSGRTRDENAWFIAGELYRLGAVLRRVSVVPDDLDGIADEVRRLSAVHDFVITTGGVGPTHDDMTPAAVARAFGVEVKTQPELERLLRGLYGDQVNDAVLRMARVPEGTEVIGGKELAFPPFRFRNVIMLPGVPKYVRNKFHVIAGLFAGAGLIREELVVSQDETAIADVLATVAAENGDVKIGSYPLSNPDGSWRRVELTVTGPDRARVGELVEVLLQRIPGSMRKEPGGEGSHV